ncbi:transglycosylase, partial [Streptococcus equi]|nr:transglycosylase [Streptococcus equi]
TPYEENGEVKTYKEVKISVDRQHYVLKRMLIEGVIDK